jgi:hypothetical protein
MKSQTTTVTLLLLVCAVLGPVAIVIDEMSIRIIIIAVQLVCLFLLGLNLRPATNHHDDHDTV